MTTFKEFLEEEADRKFNLHKMIHMDLAQGFVADDQHQVSSKSYTTNSFGKYSDDKAKELHARVKHEGYRSLERTPEVKEGDNLVYPYVHKENPSRTLTIIHSPKEGKLHLMTQTQRNRK